MDLLFHATPGRDWPANRAEIAFDLSELSRSRVLLELLGRRSAHTDPMPFQEVRALLAQADGELLHARRAWEHLGGRRSDR